MSEVQLKLTPAIGGFKWQITGLGNNFNTKSYVEAGLTIYPFTVGGTTSISGVVKDATVKAPSNRAKNSTPETFVSYASGVKTFWAWVKVPAGTYWPAGSASVVIPKSYTITLDHQGGKSSQKYVKVTIGYDVPDLDSLPKRSGYRFKGYFTREDGSTADDIVQYYNEKGKCVLENPKWSWEGDIKIFAHWAKTYRLYFDEYGGDDYVDVVKGETVEDIDPPKKDDHLFLGYYTEPNGQGVQYYNEKGKGQVKYDGEWDAITLYSYWKQTGGLFAWATEKVAGEPFNLGATEWNDLCDFVNAKRSTAYDFTKAVKGKPVTAAIYNEMVEAIGVGTTVKPRDAITADLLNDLVANANNM